MQLPSVASGLLSLEKNEFVCVLCFVGARYQNHPDIGQRRAVCPCKVSGGRLR